MNLDRKKISEDIRNESRRSRGRKMRQTFLDRYGRIGWQKVRKGVCLKKQYGNQVPGPNKTDND